MIHLIMPLNLFYLLSQSVSLTIFQVSLKCIQGERLMKENTSSKEENEHSSKNFISLAYLLYILIAFVKLIH